MHGAQLSGVALKRVPGRVLKASCCTEMVDSDSSVAVLLCIVIHIGDMFKRMRIYLENNGCEVVTSSQGSSDTSDSDASALQSGSEASGCDGSDSFTPDGEKYEGEVYDGMRHGQGTLIYPNGAKYEGEFYENQGAWAGHVDLTRWRRIRGPVQ